MFDALFRKYKDQVLQPLTALAARFSPNMLTVAAFGVGLVCAGAAAAGQLGWAFGLWLCNRLLDGLDGAVARQQQRQTDLGGYLDILLDFVVYAAVPFGLALGQPTPLNLIALAGLLASFYINGASWMYLAAILEKRALGARARGEATTVTMPDGLVGAVATFLFYCAFFLWPAWLAGLFGVMAALVLITAGQRLAWALRHLAEPTPPPDRGRPAATGRRRFQVIVIGGGAAGLATAYHLQRRGLDFVVLEKDALGHVWGRHYASLRLNTLRAVSGLPGLPMPADYPDFPTGPQVSAYLRQYAARLCLPVLEGVTVQTAAYAGGWRLATSHGEFQAETVIAATGLWSTPHWPDLPGLEAFQGVCLHSRDYHHPCDFHNQRVLVIGAGNSGAEIAAELGAAGVATTVAVREGVTFVPRPRSALKMRLAAWFFRHAPAALAERFLRRPDFAALGLPRQPGSPLAAYPVVGFRLPEAVRAGQVRVRGAVEALTPTGARFADGAEAEFDAVICATGYRPTLDCLGAAVALDARGWPILDRGRSRQNPHLFCVGFDYPNTEGWLQAIGRSARLVVDQV